MIEYADGLVRSAEEIDPLSRIVVFPIEVGK